MKIFNLPPRVPLVQTIAYATDVIITTRGIEQRIATRPHARVSYEFDIPVSSELELRRIRTDLFNHTGEPWKVPLWEEAVRLLQPASGDLLTGNFEWLNVNSNDELFIMAPSGVFELAVAIAPITDTEIALSENLTRTYPRGSIVTSVKEGVVRDATELSRYKVTAGRLPVEIDLIDQFPLGGSASNLTILGTLPVMDRRPLITDQVSESFLANLDRIDFGGKIVQRTHWDYPSIVYSKAFKFTGALEFAYWKHLLEELHGRRKGFWCPTWRPDLELVEQPATGGSVIRVSNDPNFLESFGDSLSHKGLQIHTLGGLIYRRLVGITDNEDGTISLTLNVALPNDENLSSITQLSLLEHSRLASDSVRIQHDGLQSVVSLATQTLQQNAPAEDDVPDDVPDDIEDSNLLLDAKWNEPVIQTFPDSGPFPGRNPEWVFQFDEESGPLVDRVQGLELDPVNGPIYGQEGVGLWDGETIVPKVIEGSVINTQFLGTDKISLSGTDPIAMVFVWRMSSTDGNSWFPFGLTSTETSDNIQFHVVSTALRFQAAGAETSLTAPNGTIMNDGAWHAALLYVDPTSHAAIYGDERTVTVNTAIGAYNLNTISFHLRRSSSLIQMRYAAIYKGANAAGLGQEDFEQWWVYGKDPSGFLTPIRSSTFSAIVDATGRVAHWSGLPPTPQVALGYSPKITVGAGFGLRPSPPITNLIDRSESTAHTSWTKVNITHGSNQSNSPDGFRSMNRLIATADNAYMERACVTAGSTLYTGSVWVQASSTGGPAVQMKLVLYDLTNDTELVSQAFTATDDFPQRISVEATTASNGISTALRIVIDNDGEHLHVWGFQLNVGPLRDYVRTNGAAVTAAATNNRIANSGEYLSGVRGEIEVTGVLDYPNSGAETLFDTAGVNRRRVFRDNPAAANIRTTMTDGNGSSVSPDPPSIAGIESWDEEFTVRLRWDSENELPEGANNRSIAINEVENGNVGTWEGSGVTGDLNIGQVLNASGHVHGLITGFRTFDKPRPL